MTINQLINNINNKIREFGFGYVTYHSLMEDISECVNEYEKGAKTKVDTAIDDMVSKGYDLVMDNINTTIEKSSKLRRKNK